MKAKKEGAVLKKVDQKYIEIRYETCRKEAG